MISQPPDSTQPGNYRLYYGYIVAFAAFCQLLIAFGVIYSFGVFFKPIVADFGWTRAETSLASSINIIVMGAMSMVSGKLIDRFNPTIILSISGVVLGLGYLLTSQISTLWQFYLYYGIIVGIGMGMLWVPAISVVAHWFEKYRGLVTGIVVSGIGIGTIVIPPVATRLIASYNWNLTYIILGSMIIFVVVVTSQFMRRAPDEKISISNHAADHTDPTPRFRGFVLAEAIRNGQFWIIALAWFAFFFTHQVCIVHVVPHATDLGVEPVSAASVLSVIGMTSIAGRIGLGSISDRIGAPSSLIVTLGLVMAALFCLLAARELWLFFLFAAVYGIGYGGVVALQSSIVAEIFGLRSHGVILGSLVYLGTLGGAIGPLVAGRIFDVTGSYQVAFMIIMSLSFIGLLMVFLSRFKYGGITMKRGTF